MLRKKELCIIVTFDTTTQAMQMEQLAKIHQIAGRLIPVPREITAGCGLAWRVTKEQAHNLQAWMEEMQISFAKQYELMI